MYHKIILTLILIFSFIGYSSATTYYVSNEGDDNNAGTLENVPWEHLVHACSTVVAGDTVFIMGGSWDEDDPVVDGSVDVGNIYPRNSGTSGNPIVFIAYPDSARPVLYGNQGVGDRTTIYIHGRDYIVLDGLEVENSWRGIRIEASGYITVKNCVSHHNTGPINDNAAGVMIGYDYSHDITIQNCTFYNQYEGNLADSTDGWNVSGIHVYRCKNLLIEDNTIWGQPLGFGIRMKMADTTGIVRNNVVHDCYTGIGTGLDLVGMEIYENIIYDVFSSGIRISLNTDRNADDISIYNNTIYNSANTGIHAYPNGINTNLKIWNNIVVEAYNGVDGYNLTFDADNHPGLYSDYNCYYNSGSNTVVYWNGLNSWTLAEFVANTGHGANSIQEDPLFVDAEGHDFRLQSDSPCAYGGRGGNYLGYMGALSPVDSILIIYNIGADSITTNSARIFWSTNEPATSQVEYGLDSNDYDFASDVDPDLVTLHNVGLTGLDPNTTYFYRAISIDSSNHQVISSERTFTTSLEGLENVALGREPLVSGTYADYDSAAITDGIIDPYGGNNTTWASNESTTSPHRIEIEFNEDKIIESVRVHWAWNSFQSSWTTSQQYHIQSWNGTDYADIAVVSNSDVDSMTVTDFPANTTSGVRIFQPANMGSPDYPSVIWLTELEIYGRTSTATDDGDPEEKAKDFPDIYVFPNPFRVSLGHTSITFTNLPQDSEITIATVSGEIVLKEFGVGPGEWIWDVKNSSGKDIASGVYFFVVEYPSNSADGKVMIIR